MGGVVSSMWVWSGKFRVLTSFRYLLHFLLLDPFASVYTPLLGVADMGPGIRVLESLKAGRRLPEARFGTLKVASKGQPSVYGVFSKKPSIP